MLSIESRVDSLAISCKHRAVRTVAPSIQAFMHAAFGCLARCIYLSTATLRLFTIIITDHSHDMPIPSCTPLRDRDALTALMDVACTPDHARASKGTQNLGMQMMVLVDQRPHESSTTGWPHYELQYSLH